MPGSFDLNPIPVSVANSALPIAVCLYNPAGVDSPYTILPNVRCLRIDFREGPEPPVARFQYLQGDVLQTALGWPSQFQQLWPIDAQGNYVVLTDDRLVVLTQDPSGNPIVLFDGFAQMPQVDLSPQHHIVTFVALGVAIRLWDNPISNRVQRNASAADTTNGSADIVTGLPCRWNPSDSSVGALGGYIGNCVATADYTEASQGSFPVFLDPLVLERGDANTSYWYVSDALSYLIANEPSPLDGSDSPYVNYPTISGLQAILSCYAPAGTGTQNSGDVTETNIQIRDYDATNKAVPEVFADLLAYCGFVMFFYQDQYPDGTPLTRLTIERRDALSTVTPKPVYLAAIGASSLDPTANNTTSLHLVRDCNNVVNQWAVETALKQVEVTIYLAPGFEPSAGDAANPKPFYSSNLTNATSDQRRMYRWYIADECADGHWNVDSASWVQSAPDFSSIFPPDNNGNATYCSRYRPGSNTLISKDVDGKPLKAVLEYAKGTTSTDPGIADVDPAETNWFTIAHGWRLLNDRLGIEVTVEDPDTWNTGAKGVAIRGVLWSASPSADTNFRLRLTTVIEFDQRMPIIANKRIASPTAFARQRTADGKDHFQYCEVALNSLNYTAQGGDGIDPVIVRDDTAAATTHAEQLRSAHEFPTLAGSLTIPFITDYYGIADQINVVQGRNVSLQINVGVDQGETPTYPWITAFAWDFQDDRQQTILQLSDRRAEPQTV